MRARYNKGNWQIDFYQKEDDEKLSFLINGTSSLLYLFKKNRIRIKDLKYAVKGIFETSERLEKNGEIPSPCGIEKDLNCRCPEYEYQ